MESTINANLNNADCLKNINNIGSTTYQNVCNGTYSTVPWGAMDYVLRGAMDYVLIGLLFLCIILLGVVLYKIFTDHE
jgi:hypothetical protein